MWDENGVPFLSFESFICKTFLIKQIKSAHKNLFIPSRTFDRRVGGGSRLISALSYRFIVSLCFFTRVNKWYRWQLLGADNLEGVTLRWTTILDNSNKKIRSTHPPPPPPPPISMMEKWRVLLCACSSLNLGKGVNFFFLYSVQDLDNSNKKLRPPTPPPSTPQWWKNVAFCFARTRVFPKIVWIVQKSSDINSIPELFAS